MPLIPGSGTALGVKAPAKVNLFLRILERMPDGYHQLETLFQAVGLEDEILMEVVEGTSLELRVEGADVGPSEDNLVTRAVHLFRHRTGLSCGLRIQLTKRIPAGAGLGGGSSDAGATLRALNVLHGYPLGGDEMRATGAELGADVAFFSGEVGLAVGEGRGDRLTPVEPLPPRTLVVGLPPVHVATGPAYGLLAGARGSAPPPPPLLPFELGTWDQVEDRAVNDFQPVVARAHPPVARALEALREVGASVALLSGSGSAVFGLFSGGGPGPGTLRTLQSECDEARWIAVQTLSHLPAPFRVESGRSFH
jgi:4-diphosphocytidyl-2-C-methyl-D-erythritol kinase